MGGWGPGNFDSDLAMDWYLNDFGKAMIGRLRKIAGDKTLLEPDESESVEFLCTLQVLTVLDEHLCPILPGRSETLAGNPQLVRQETRDAHGRACQSRSENWWSRPQC